MSTIAAMDGSFLLQYAGYFVVLAALLGASSFFSGSETALFSLSPGAIQQLRARGRSGRLAAGLLDRPAVLLQALLLGNMLVNVAFASVAATLSLHMLQAYSAHWVAVLVTLGPLLALILLAEVLPKLLAVSHAQRVAMLVSWPAAALVKTAGPVLWVLQRVLIGPLTRLAAGGQPARREITPDELAAVLALSAKRGAIDTDAHSLLQEIMELTDLRARDIMVPRVDMVAFEINGPRAVLAGLLARTHLRKVPVYQDHLDNILGVIHAKTLLLRPQTPLRELVARAAFVPEAARLERVLLQFRVTRMQMAIVVDEYGGTAGLITLQDVLEEMVGDLPDPFSPEEAAVAAQRDGSYLLDGNLPVHELADALKMNLAPRHISTIGGFVTSLIGRIAHEGETVAFRNLQFTVVSMRKRRIGKLRLELVQPRIQAPGLDAAASRPREDGDHAR
ncbi:MAG: hemolysin family protein [Planctomycetaceae bacterium]|nr:hemolysin family protein [Planctomycetaceae bacterium]